MDDLQITPAGSIGPVPPNPDTNPTSTPATSFNLKLDGIMTDQAETQAAVPAVAQSQTTPIIPLEPTPVAEPTSVAEPAPNTLSGSPSAPTSEVAPPAAIPMMLETSTQATLPAPSPEPVEAAAGEPQPLPEDVAPKSNKMKIPMIVGGIFIILVAGATILYFGKGWFLQGDVAHNAASGGVIELCPTGYYAPKPTTSFNADFSKDIKTAKAQLLFTDPEKVLTAVDKANDTAAVIDANNKAMELIDSGLSGETGDAVPATDPALISPIVPAPTALPDNTPDSGLPPEDLPPADPTLVVPAGCIPIPHDDLNPGGNECGLISELFINSVDYRINDETTDLLNNWESTCNPVKETNDTSTPKSCGENQETSPTSGQCVCSATHFDVSSVIAPVSPAPGGAGTGTIDPTNVRPPLTCWKCSTLLNALEEATALSLKVKADPDSDQSLLIRINGMETLAVANKCKLPIELEPCGENELRDGTGSCMCMPGYKKDPAGDMCKYDCQTLIAEIVALRPVGAQTLDPGSAGILSSKEATAMANNCPVPKVEENTCNTYSRGANEAFNTQDYDAFYENSKKFLAENCPGGTPDTCSSLLTQGVAVNKILAASMSESVISKYKTELKSVSDQFYQNEICNKVEQRCSEIAAAKVDTGPSLPAPINAAAGTRNNMAITPSSVFKDDAEYAQQYCVKKELTCEEIVSNTTLEDLVKMDLSSEERSKYEACLTASNQGAPASNPLPSDNIPPANTPVPGTITDLPPVIPVQAPTPNPDVAPSSTAIVSPPAAPAIVSPPTPGGGSSAGSSDLPMPTPAKPEEMKAALQS